MTKPARDTTNFRQPICTCGPGRDRISALRKPPTGNLRMRNLCRTKKPSAGNLYMRVLANDRKRAAHEERLSIANNFEKERYSPSSFRSFKTANGLSEGASSGLAAQPQSPSLRLAPHRGHSPLQSSRHRGTSGTSTRKAAWISGSRSMVWTVGQNFELITLNVFRSPNFAVYQIVALYFAHAAHGNVFKTPRARGNGVAFNHPGHQEGVTGVGDVDRPGKRLRERVADRGRPSEPAYRASPRNGASRQGQIARLGL